MRAGRTGVAASVAVSGGSGAVAAGDGSLLKMAEPATNMSAPASAISRMFPALTPPSTCHGAGVANGDGGTRSHSGAGAACTVVRWIAAAAVAILLPPPPPLPSLLTWSEMSRPLSLISVRASRSLSSVPARAQTRRQQVSKEASLSLSAAGCR